MKKVIQLFVCLSLVAVFLSCGALSAFSIVLTTVHEDSGRPEIRPVHGNKGQRKPLLNKTLNNEPRYQQQAAADTVSISATKTGQYFPCSF